MAAQFEIRQHRLDAARKILGMALGLCPKDKIFNSYITLELQLGQFERCRQLYAKYLEWRPENCKAWCKWVELEQSLGEVERCRAMYELAIQMPVLDMPEVLWKVETSASLKLNSPLPELTCHSFAQCSVTNLGTWRLMCLLNRFQITLRMLCGSATICACSVVHPHEMLQRNF